MEQTNNLQNMLLIAMPSLQDTHFSQTVIYLCEHNKNGAMGIIINRPLHVTLGEILKHLEIPIIDDHVYEIPVLSGGPIAQERGFIIQRNHSLSENSGGQGDHQNNEIDISVSKEDLALLAQGQRLKDSLVSLGYSGWIAGQLEQELADNTWLVVPTNSTILFDVPFEDRWRKAAQLIGVDIDRLSGEIGHA